MVERLAVEGGQPVRDEAFPRWPIWGDEERHVLNEVLESGDWWAPEGTQVHAFERDFAAYQDAAFGVAVTNGSAAIEVALLAAGLDWGDEVITTPYTFIATASAPLLVGAIPRFVDILPDTWNLDPEQVEAAITPRTRAIIPVHIGGEPADMDAICAIARRHGLVVIEDAAQAHGATWQGRKVGAIGDMGTFSFQASKNMTAGEAGIIVTNSEAYWEKVWSVHNVGRAVKGAWYGHITLASNYRLTEWQGAVLRCQLARLDEQNARRSANAALLSMMFSEIEGLDALPGDPRVTCNAYHLYKMWYTPEAFGGHSSGEFARAMKAEGIPLSVGYGAPLNESTVVTERRRAIRKHLGLADEPDEVCPIANEACLRGLWLPQYALLGQPADMEDIAWAALKIQQAWQ